MATVLKLENLKPFSLAHFSILLRESCNCLSIAHKGLALSKIWRNFNIILKDLSLTIYFYAKHSNREDTSLRNTHFLFKWVRHFSIYPYFKISVRLKNSDKDRNYTFQTHNKKIFKTPYSHVMWCHMMFLNRKRPTQQVHF